MKLPSEERIYLVEGLLQWNYLSRILYNNLESGSSTQHIQTRLLLRSVYVCAMCYLILGRGFPWLEIPAPREADLF